LLFILISDIQEVVWEMSTNKAADEEGFQAEFFKHGLHALDYYLVDLFNHVVCTGFPQAWSHHTIHPIHKSGPSADPNNYRTIMVGHTFSKLYAIVLHMKLSRELERRLLRARGQAGFIRHIRPLITSLHSGPSLRRHNIALRKSIVAL
jgi:hypothetical protein